MVDDDILKMKKRFLFALLLASSWGAAAQENLYGDSLQAFRENYLIHHEVVIGRDKKQLRFFQINSTYRVHATFEKLTDSVGFIMKTSGTKDKKYYRYGRLSFTLQGNDLQLTMYQSHQLMQDSTYNNYLFVPFTDGTSGGTSYAGGRYIDFQVPSVQNGTVLIDFNKAYNPYCAYTTGYNCPIPPRENHLPVPVRSGERNFRGKIKSRK